MKYIAGCVCLGKKAGIYSLVKGLPQLKHTSTCTHTHLLQDQHVWVPVGSCGWHISSWKRRYRSAGQRRALGRPKMGAVSMLLPGAGWSQHRTGHCSCSRRCDRQVWQRGNRWFQEEPGRVNMHTSDHSHPSVLSNCFKFGGTNKRYYCLLKVTLMMFHMTQKHNLQWV